MTLHRDFNVDYKEKLEGILKQVNRVAKKIKVVFPIHPRTKRMINEFGLESLLEGILVINPIDYLKLMGLTAKCFKVITDSGGYQKEAYFAGKQAIILMPDTSWRELINLKFNILSSEQTLYLDVLENQISINVADIYGNGNAAKNIIHILRHNFMNVRG